MRAGANNRIAVNYVSVGWRMVAESTDLDRVRQLNVGMSETTNLCVCVLLLLGHVRYGWDAGIERMVYKRARPPLLREKQTKGTHARISRTPQVRGSCREYRRERWAKKLVLTLLFFSSAFFVFGASISTKYFLRDLFSTIFNQISL